MKGEGGGRMGSNHHCLFNEPSSTSLSFTLSYNLMKIMGKEEILDCEI